MANYNRVILAGNLTRDPQMSYLPSQTPVVEFGLAINRQWRGQDGQQRQETCFIDCTAFGRQAEVITQYMSKGRGLLVEGRLQFQTWEGKDGTRRSKHRVVVDNFQFLGGREGSAPGPRPLPQQASQQQPMGGPQGGGGYAPPQAQPPRAQPAPDSANTDQPPPSAYDDAGGEEIPF